MNPPKDTFLRNVLLKSFLIHYRALLEFFGHPRPRASDLSLLRSDEWRDHPLAAVETDAIRTMVKAAFERWFDPIGQQLAHCTHPRYEQKQIWPIQEMQDQIERALAEFERVARFPERER